MTTNEGQGSEQAPKTRMENTFQKIEGLFDEINLKRFMPPTQTKKVIGTLGAGFPPEIVPLDRYCNKNGFGKPKIIAYDISSYNKSLAEAYAERFDVDLEYRIRNVAESSVFEGIEFDLAFIRNPRLGNAKETEDWKIGVARSFEHLKSGGSLIFTTIEPDVADFARKELGKLGEVMDYSIPQVYREGTLLNELDLFVVQKN